MCKISNTIATCVTACFLRLISNVERGKPTNLHHYIQIKTGVNFLSVYSLYTHAHFIKCDGKEFFKPKRLNRISVFSYQPAVTNICKILFDFKKNILFWLITFQLNCSVFPNGIKLFLKKLSEKAI